MLAHLPDITLLGIVLAGALIAGFTSGFAGFGTGLVSSGFWFHALPAPVVPPLVAMAAVAAQIVGLISVREAFDWRSTWPYLLGGVIGVPIGVVCLRHASPELLRLSVGAFLAIYALSQLLGLARFRVGNVGGRPADGLVGVGGGFLGGFAGLSGPAPLIWLQMRGGPSASQRAIYQPFNLVILSAASVAMAVGGVIDAQVITIAVLCLPVTLVGAWLGARTYKSVSEETFRKVVLALLLLSGIILIFQTLT